MTGELHVTGPSLLDAVPLSELPSDPASARDIASSARLWRDMREQALTRDERSQREQDLAQAREEGYRAGLLDGRSAAESEGLDVLTRLPSLLEQARARLEEQVAQATRDTSPVLVETALEIARWALAREVSVAPEVLLEVAERALAEAGGASGASLHVPPDMGAVANKWAARFGVDRPEIIEDSAVPGGVVCLKSKSGGIGEVSVAALVARAAEALHVQPPAHSAEEERHAGAHE